MLGARGKAPAAAVALVHEPAYLHSALAPVFLSASFVCMVLGKSSLIGAELPGVRRLKQACCQSSTLGSKEKL